MSDSRSAETPPPGFPVPVQIGERIIGWAAPDVAARLTDAGPPPRLILVPAAPAVLAVRQQRRFLLVPQASVIYVTSLGGIVTVHAEAGRFWSDLTLTEVEHRLDPRSFYRLDRSHLINLTRIAELIPWTHQRYRLVFGDAARTELLLSRDVGRRLRAALGW